MESMIAVSPSAPNGTTTPSPNSLPVVDSALVIEYLASVLEITLGATRKDLESFGSLLSKSRYADTAQRCARFATESQLALYVQKEIAYTEDRPEDSSGMPSHVQKSETVLINTMAKLPYPTTTPSPLI